ncbi:MAG: efflux RND transporter permease subunit [Planctomycetaceae bacterium]
MLVIVVLVLFLFDWRAALISSTAIPLSLIAAAMVLYYRGGTINTMVLAGLIIALGEVVDDAIIDVENILRRLRLNQESPSPKSAYRVVLDASLEVRSAVVYASVIVVLTLLPVFFLEGLAGSFFRPLAASYVLAIAASYGGVDGHTGNVLDAVALSCPRAQGRTADSCPQEVLWLGTAVHVATSLGC